MSLKQKNNQIDPKTFICKTKMTIKFLYNHSTCFPPPPPPLKSLSGTYKFFLSLSCCILLYTYCNLKDDKLSKKKKKPIQYTHTHTHTYFFKFYFEILAKKLKVVFGWQHLDLDFKSMDLKCLDLKSIDFKIPYLDLFIKLKI